MQTQSNFEDPKIILTSSLIKQRDMIVSMLNLGSSAGKAAALRAMATLISQVNIDPSEQKLLKSRTALLENTVVSTIPADQAMYYFQSINEYLNKTYFADFHHAKPKFSEEGHI